MTANEIHVPICDYGLSSQTYQRLLELDQHYQNASSSSKLNLALPQLKNQVPLDHHGSKLT